MSSEDCVRKGIARGRWRSSSRKGYHSQATDDRRARKSKPRQKTCQEDSIPHRSGGHRRALNRCTPRIRTPPVLASDFRKGRTPTAVGNRMSCSESSQDAVEWYKDVVGGRSKTWSHALAYCSSRRAG